MYYFILFYVTFECICVQPLPPGIYPIAVGKYIKINLSSPSRVEVKTSGVVILFSICAFVSLTGETLPIKHSKIIIHECHTLKAIFYEHCAMKW
jgi:hypothetical protein